MQSLQVVSVVSFSNAVSVVSFSNAVSVVIGVNGYGFLCLFGL
jgi:hypothetical protein